MSDTEREPQQQQKRPTREAGRSLDAEVAEKVMGWEYPDPPSPAAGESFAAQYWDHINRLTKRKRPASHGWAAGLLAPVPHYSTDMAEAWSVVDRFPAERNISIIRNDKLGWVVSLIADLGNPQRIVQGVARTAPLAICLAALSAVESHQSISEVSWISPGERKPQ